MKTPRNLKGSDLVEILCKSYDYQIIYQQGSHIILETESPFHQRISIPNHTPLRVGTLNSILRAVAHHKQITKNEILKDL